MKKILMESSITSLPLLSRGKVRDIYGINDKRMFIVTTDRMSAFDIILPTPIPYKGAVLNSISDFWFSKTEKMILNHVRSTPKLEEFLTAEEISQVSGRGIVVEKLNPLPVEAIVRGHLVGSGWRDYQETGAVCGVVLPKGLELASKLEQPIFTPSTKATAGTHDENVNFESVCREIGFETANKIRCVSLFIFSYARYYAERRGIIIADTKLEFGTDNDGALYLIDEVLTPDSSRFWPMDKYKVGSNPESFDKQFVRDYLETLEWNKEYPGPELPEEIVEATTCKYIEALERLSGRSLVI